MSMYSLTGKVIHCYDREVKGENDKPEIRHKVQIMGEMPVAGGGIRFEMVDLTCEDHADYRRFLNRTIRVPLGVFSPARGQIVHFIPKGSIPFEVEA